MRLLPLIVCGAAALQSGRYGFLQGRPRDDDAMIVDEAVEEVQRPTRGPLQAVIRSKPLLIAGALAVGLLGGSQIKGMRQFAPAHTGEASEMLSGMQRKDQITELSFNAATGTVTETTWSQGYRKGYSVMKSEVPVQLPNWGLAPPAVQQPGKPWKQPVWTIVHSEGATLPEVPGPTSIVPAPGAGKMGDMGPPDGWQWPQTGAESGFDTSLIGSVIEFDMVGFGQIHCGCQANIYLTKAPGDNQPATCDAGGNGYGCYELDFMEGNAAAIGSTIHLCGDENRGNFMCQDDRCLSSHIGGKQGGGEECDSWGCATNTKDLPDVEGKKVYGQGGYIDSNQDFKMSLYFEPTADGGQLDNIWVKLDQNGKDVTYKVCDAANYVHAYTQAASTGWTTQSTYWGGGDSMEWLNGPCWDFPGSCDGSAGAHVQNVKKLQTGGGAAPPSGGSSSGEKKCVKWSQ